MFFTKHLSTLVVLVSSSFALGDGDFFMFPGINRVGLASAARTNNSSTDLPVNYGLVVFPGFQALDVFGPLDALNLLSLSYHTNLSIIAETLDPVSTIPRSPEINQFNSTFGESIVPTHTFKNPPPNIDVLLIPGGFGVVDPGTANAVNFIRDTYPSLKYLITVCAGSWLAARAGVLDGRNATSNKAGWAEGVKLGDGVHWVAKARWVKDGNIYTTSGVSAGIDGTLAFIRDVYGKETADYITNVMEYDRHTDPSWDPWADFYNLTDVNN